MNDYYGSIVHRDRLAELRREAEQFRRAASLRGSGRGQRGVMRRALSAPIAWLGIGFVLLRGRPARTARSEGTQ